MTDSTNEGFDPSEVEATRGREQGLGVGERELQRQRDVGDVVAAPEEDRDFQSASQDQDDETSAAIAENTSVLGEDDEEGTGWSDDQEATEDVTSEETVDEDEI